MSHAARSEFGRIGVIGAGAMGSSLAAILGRAAPVAMVVRNPSRAAQIFERGVVVDGLLQARSRPLLVRDIDELAALGDVGAVFIATKTTAIPSVCASLKPALSRLGVNGRAVRLVSYQNGIDPGREIMRLLDHSTILRMVLNYGAVLDDSSGVVHVTMHEPPHYIGCVSPELTDDCRRLSVMMTAAEFPTEYEPDIERPVWIKGILNAAMNPVAALVDSAIGEVLDSPARPVVHRLLAEGIAVATREGIQLPEHFERKAFDIFERAAEHVPSMVEDIRRGRESEVGQLNRQIIEHARAIDVAVPTHETVDALIEAFDWRVYHGRRAAERLEEDD